MSTEERRNGRLKRPLRRLEIWSKIPEVLCFPAFCELCGSFLDFPGDNIICRKCWEKLRPAGDSFCPVCGRFFESEGKSHLCLDCQERRPPFTRHRSCARYGGILKDLILLFKYRGFEGLGLGLADFLCRSLAGEEDLWEGVEAVIPVPLHPKRLKERGFNQAEILARQVARRKGLPLLKRRLIRTRYSPPQTTLEGKEREMNIRGAFKVRRRGDVRGKTVLLIDDVYTTGSTIRECSLALIEGEAEEVRAVTLARA